MGHIYTGRGTRFLKSFKVMVVEPIRQMPDRQIDYLTFIALPYFIYGCCILGVSHPGLDLTILVVAFTGVGLLRAVRFPSLADAVWSLFLGWFVAFAAASLVTLLHPAIGGPLSWLHLGFIGSLAFSAPAAVLYPLRSPRPRA
jgi:hypothetical protein